MFIVEVRGNEVYPTGGATPEEEYGAGIWGPAVFGNANRTGLASTDASTFTTEEQARVLLIHLTMAVPSGLDFRIREIV